MRRLIRRVIRLLKKADIGAGCICGLSEVIIGQYGEVYLELWENREFILEQLQKECALFSKTLDEGLKRANHYLDKTGGDGVLNGALQKVLGEEVAQRGSNITSERLRFDFSFGRKVTGEELEQVSAIVNKAIAEKIDVVLEEMTPKEAYASGAVGVFSDKYGERVKVYTIEGYSKEICGGPHAKNTGELGFFRILKEEASSAGVRRIKAVIGEAQSGEK